MNHLTADELKLWYEHGSATDRSRVIGHLAECESCRKALSACAIAAEPEGSEPAITVDEAVRRGYAARTSATSPSVFGWLRPAYGLAAAAVVIVAVVWVMTPERGGDDHTVRSAELSGMSPAGDSAATAFTFASPFEASSYRLTVRDASGVMVISVTSSAQAIPLDMAMREKLTAGQSYTWIVAALDRSGETIAESKPVTFRYRP